MACGRSLLQEDPQDVLLRKMHTALSALASTLTLMRRNILALHCSLNKTKKRNEKLLFGCFGPINPFQ